MLIIGLKKLNVDLSAALQVYIGCLSHPYIYIGRTPYRSLNAHNRKKKENHNDNIAQPYISLFEQWLFFFY